jgi:hypothetical protein
MLLHKPGFLVKRLVELGDASTTLFLESMRGGRLKVLMECQEETEDSLIRVVKLFFDLPHLPLLYCKSHLLKTNLTDREYLSLLDGILPIGVVFHSLNDISSIKKTDIDTTSEISPELAGHLNVSSPLILKKKYSYWVGHRNIGYITEYFNEESLSRL